MTLSSLAKPNGIPTAFLWLNSFQSWTHYNGNLYDAFVSRLSKKLIGHLLSLLFQSCIGGWASSRAAKIGDVTI
jgi:hypothetical protein